MSGSVPVRELTRNQKVEAALGNEYLTRQRVERLEALYAHHAQCAIKDFRRLKEISEELTDPLRRGFPGRLRWLLLGK